MIITAHKAVSIISNHAVVKAVPELLDAVEAYVEKKRQWQPKKGCGNCDEVSFFQPLEDTALKAIAGLAPDAIQRLKKFLSARDLYINITGPNGRIELKPLQ
jgi:hypothetical protein